LKDSVKAEQPVRKEIDLGKIRNKFLPDVSKTFYLEPAGSAHFRPFISHIGHCSYFALV
jgi:hypothetical protein